MLSIEALDWTFDSKFYFIQMAFVILLVKLSAVIWGKKV